MSLNRQEIIDIFKKTGALLEGHFILTSGLHSGAYFQCAKVFQYPWHAEKLCSAIAEHFKNDDIGLVASPAIGGIVVGQEIARLLKVRSIFTERKEGVMTLRRGFEVKPGEKVLVAEDVTTTGGSVRELIDVLTEKGADLHAVTAVVDRSGGRVAFDAPYHSLLQMKVKNYDPESCPLCKSGSPAVKPGSRTQKSE
jgi:orotate phosphoribosyltransferase